MENRCLTYVVWGIVFLLGVPCSGFGADINVMAEKKAFEQTAMELESSIRKGIPLFLGCNRAFSELTNKLNVESLKEHREEVDQQLSSITKDLAKTSGFSAEGGCRGPILSDISRFNEYKESLNNTQKNIKNRVGEKLRQAVSELKQNNQRIEGGLKQAESVCVFSAACKQSCAEARNTYHTAVQQFHQLTSNYEKIQNYLEQQAKSFDARIASRKKDLDSACVTASTEKKEESDISKTKSEVGSKADPNKSLAKSEEKKAKSAVAKESSRQSELSSKTQSPRSTASTAPASSKKDTVKAESTTVQALRKSEALSTSTAAQDSVPLPPSKPKELSASSTTAQESAPLPPSKPKELSASSTTAQDSVPLPTSKPRGLSAMPASAPLPISNPMLSSVSTSTLTAESTQNDADYAWKLQSAVNDTANYANNYGGGGSAPSVYQDGIIGSQTKNAVSYYMQDPELRSVFLRNLQANGISIK